MRTTVKSLAVLTPAALWAWPGAAHACVVCNEGGMNIWPILISFFGAIALGFGCLLAYMFLYTNKNNVEEPAKDMLDAEFTYGVRGV